MEDTPASTASAAPAASARQHKQQAGSGQQQHPMSPRARNREDNRVCLPCPRTHREDNPNREDNASICNNSAWNSHVAASSCGLWEASRVLQPHRSRQARASAGRPGRPHGSSGEPARTAKEPRNNHKNQDPQDPKPLQKTKRKKPRETKATGPCENCCRQKSNYSNENRNELSVLIQGSSRTRSDIGSVLYSPCCGSARGTAPGTKTTDGTAVSRQEPKATRKRGVGSEREARAQREQSGRVKRARSRQETGETG